MLSGADDVEPGAWPNVAWLDNGCSGVIVAPDLVVFAAHCGTAVTAAWFSDSLQLVIDAAAGTAEPVPQSGASSISITRCETYPNWALANGTDLAFCILSTPAIQQSLIAPPLTGCLHDRLAAGVSVTLVGFGRSTPDGAPGRKRVLEVPITHVGVELSIGDAEYGSCAGDSGSPAFVAVDPTTREDWHLVGVLSTGLAGDGCGVGFYGLVNGLAVARECQRTRCDPLLHGRWRSDRGVLPRDGSRRERRADERCAEDSRLSLSNASHASRCGRWLFRRAAG